VLLSASAFYALSSPAELATCLKISLNALSYISLVTPGRECRRPDCSFPQVENNRCHCVCCSQSWFPTSRLDGDLLVKERGHLLLDPSLTNKVPGTKTARRRTCCCENKVCYGLGYTSSLFCMPTDNEIRRQWYLALGLSQEKRSVIDKNPSSFSVNFWHFSPDHLERRGNDLWQFKRANNYTDADKKVWHTRNRPPPNYGTQHYIDVKYNSRTPPSLRWMDPHRDPPHGGQK
jgi:hypothetical protein